MFYKAITCDNCDEIQLYRMPSEKIVRFLKWVTYKGFHFCCKECKEKWKLQTSRFLQLLTVRWEKVFKISPNDLQIVAVAKKSARFRSDHNK